MSPSNNMSNTPVQDPSTQGPLSGSGQTLPSRPLQPTSEPSASKRVCFYKSGDHKFSGHRMIITARTFKTFDALLDALSKKVPLPFGVRTITTPRGTHLVKALEDLQDGGAYVCSDQKRVKPLNLDEVNRQQVPWNTTRLLSAGRRSRQGLRFRQLGRGSDAIKRPAKVTERVAVRTPKKLLVIKNRDPTAKRTIVLQRRTAPTFDALLDYLSQIFQFPVLKLFSTDGRRVDGLAALILCSGVVVAAGNEPYRLGNYNFQRTGQMAQIMFVENVEPPALQPKMHPSSEINKSISSGRGSRNFSLSSERFIVNQINKSQNGSLNGFLHHPNGLSETEAREHHASMETREDNEPSSCIVPHDDDIEKSFCVNPDGSMTVEMKVRLTIKEEEMLHWTTTLSRSSLSKRTVCTSGSGSGNNSPDSNNTVAKDSSNIQEDESKEENHRDGDVRFNDEQICESYPSTTLGSAKTKFKRMPTPGPRHVNKRASVENVKVVSQGGVQESTTSHYSYIERTEDGETAEEYCIIRHSSSSSSSSRPIPKPRKTPSSGKSSKRSSVRTSGPAEVHQIQKDVMEVTETVMHIYESQGCYDNYFANKEYSADSLHGSPPVAESKPSTDSRPRSSSNDCDIDCTWQPHTAESLQRQKEEMLSLSSEPESLRHQVTNISSSAIETEAANAQITEKVKSEITQKSFKKKKMIRPTGIRKSSASTSSTEMKHKEISTSEHSKKSSTDRLSSDASVGKKNVNSKTSKSGLKKKEPETKAEKSQSKMSVTDEKMSPKQSAFLFHSENVKTTPAKRKNSNPATAKDNRYDVNTPTVRPQMKKNMSDIFQTRKSPSSSTKTLIRPKSLIECRLPPPKVNVELSDSGSVPSLNPSPSEIHQYVEKWLEKVSPDSVPYSEEGITERAEPCAKVVFKIGDDSESEEINEPQTHVTDAMKKSSSCLSVPLFHEGPATSARGLCVSMPSVRADPLNPEYRLRLHRSAEAIGPDDSEMSSSNTLSPKEKIKPALRQLCSSIQCIRRASTNDTSSTLQNSNSLPNFSTQVATVFGSSCKAFLSFLSVMTLKDSMKGSIPAEDNQSGTTSEAMLMMESLQKISAIENEKEQWASLTDLQSRASSQFRERWKDFQILRERLESEPLSPRVSETEFALDVVSEGGDLFEDQYLGIDELMQELNMPQDLRAEITSTIHAKSFYPMEESTFAETIKNHSDSEEDVEQFINEYKETKLSPEPESTTEDINETKQENNESDDAQELHTEIDVPTKDEEAEREECVTAVDCENTKEIDEKEEWERKEDELQRNMGKEGKIEKLEDWEEEKISDIESVEKGSEEELTGDEESMRDSLEGSKQETMMKGVGLVDEETGDEDTVQDTDEREGADETETEENSEGGEQDEEDEAETLTDEGEENLEFCCENLHEEENGSEGESEETEVHEEATTSFNMKEHEKRHSFIEDREETEEEEVTEEIRNVLEEKMDVHENENRETDRETDDSTQEVEDVIEGANEKTEKDVEGIKEEDGKQFIEEDIERISDEKEHSEVKEESEPEEDRESAKDTEDEKFDQVEAGRNVLEKESAEEEEVIGELEADENITARQSVDEEERDSDEENELNGRLKQVKTLPKDETEVGKVSEDSFADEEDCKHTLDKMSSQQQHTTSCEETNLQYNPKSPSNHSSEGQCEDDKGTETVHDTDEGEECKETSSNLSHPVEISQELLDFVNDALQSYSLVFTYDTQGNIRIVPDNARVVQIKQSLIPKARKDNSYGLKSLPSPITSDLSDYRPETSGSGGYKTQESVDVVSESGEEFSDKPFSFKTRSAHETETTNKEHANKDLSVASSSGASHSSRIKSSGSFCSSEAGTKASREDLSYFSAASSLKADTEPEIQSEQCVPFTSEKELADGVLIDRGRWLLKENHLIRKSPPVSLGMYGNLDSTSIDTAQDNMSEGSPPYTKTQHSPLAAISSSELEEMAKPLTPKCTYFNMPHGSDSDPFLDDNSIRSAKHDWSSVKARGFKVSPTVDTSKTWAARNGSLSSFASVEFKIPDSKVHPEGESSAARQTRRTSNGEQGALQPQDSLESLHLRCGQYCPIL